MCYIKLKVGIEIDHCVNFNKKLTNNKINILTQEQHITNTRTPWRLILIIYNNTLI